MTLSVSDVVQAFEGLEARGVGTEAEWAAREALITVLAGETDIETREEGLRAPRHDLLFLWVMAGLLWLTLYFYEAGPAVMATVALLAWFAVAWYMDGRSMPLLSLGAGTLTANLVAEREDAPADRFAADRPLLLIMAHLDSKPHSLLAGLDGAAARRRAVLAAIGILFLPVLMMAVAPGVLTLTLKLLLAMLVFMLIFGASLGFWRRGYEVGAVDNVSGLAGAVVAASRLWRRSGLGADVRLLITTGSGVNRYGAQHYYRQHSEELQTRPLHILHLDQVAYGRLGYVARSGRFSDLFARGRLVDLAAQAGLQPIRRLDGHGDTTWFARAGVDCLTLMADGAGPDRFEALDAGVIERAAATVEALASALYSRNLKD